MPRLQAFSTAFPQAAFFLGLALLAVFSLLFQWAHLDRAAAAYFYHAGVDAWPGQRWAWGQLFHRFGELPALIAGIFGLAAFIASFVSERWRRWRGPGLYLSALLLLGSGLLVNGLLKPLCGRPRPLETMGFGGLWDFQSAWQLGLAGRGRSFVSGHAANAWYFLSLYFLWPRRRWVLGAAVSFGMLMSLARVSQGAHWPSDTLISGALMLSLAAGLAPLIHWQPPVSFFKRPAFWLPASLALLAWLSLNGFQFEDRRFMLFHGEVSGRIPAQLRPLVVDFGAANVGLKVDAELQASNLLVRFVPRPAPGAPPMGVEGRFHGQGLPGAKETLDLRPMEGAGLALRLEETLRGFWLKKAGLVELSLAWNVPVEARLHTDQGLITIGPLPPGRRARLSGLPEGSSPPLGFAPEGNGVWTLHGAEPPVLLDLKAKEVRFLAPGT